MFDLLLCLLGILPFFLVIGVLTQALPHDGGQSATPIITEHKPLDWFKPDPKELARHDDPEKVRLLGADMLVNGQLSPVAALEDGRMIFGHCRLLGGRSAGLKTLEVKIYPLSLPELQLKLLRAAENLQRTDLSAHRRWLLCADLMCANPTWRQKDLAEALHFSESMICRFLSPSKCPPAAQEALAAGKIDLAQTYEISKGETPQEQARLLAEALAGGTRKALSDSRNRQKRNGAPEERTNRIKIELASGVTAIFSGKDLSLDEAIDAAADARKQMCAGRDRGLTAKTISKVSAEVAKKGE